MVNGNSGCSGGCVDISQGSLDKIRLDLDDCSNSPIMSITISKVVNNRYTGPSQDFSLTSYTEDGQMVVQAMGNAQITEPSLLSANLSILDQYYRGNPSALQINVSNLGLMQVGDYFTLSLGDVYSVPTGAVFCYVALCEYNSADNSVKITPSSSQIISAAISLIIDGLESSQTQPATASQVLTLRLRSHPADRVEGLGIDYEYFVIGEIQVNYKLTCENV